MQLYSPCVISSWTSWPLKMGQIICPEMSITKYQFTLRKVPEERKSHEYSSLHMSVCRLSAYLQLFIYVQFNSIQFFSIQINQPTRCNSFTDLLLDIYMWLNMFRAPLRPSSGAYNCTRSLWFYRWSVAVGALLFLVWQVNNLPAHD
jgi:hypothetical protein